MAKGSSRFYYKDSGGLGRIRVSINTTDTDVATGGADDSDVYSLNIINTTASVRELTVSYYDGANTDIVAVITIPANAGRALGVYSVELIKQEYLPDIMYAPGGKSGYIRLRNGDKIKMKISTGGASNGDLLVLGHQMNF